MKCDEFLTLNFQHGMMVNVFLAL